MNNVLKIALILFCTATDVFSEPYDTKAELRMYLQDFYSSAVFDEKLQEKFKTSTHKNLFYEHATNLLLNDMVLDALSEELFANKDLLSRDPSLAEEFGASWSMAKALSGISRLSDEDQRFFLKLVDLQFSIYDEKTCGKIVREELNSVELQQVEMKALDEISPQLIFKYLKLLESSLIAELSDFPIKRTLGISETKIVEERFSDSLLELLEQHPRAEEVYKAYETSFPSDYAACETARLAVEAILSLEGQVGKWATRYIINQMY